MSDMHLTEELKVSLREEVEAACGLVSGSAVAEVFRDTTYHGVNYTCELVHKKDHLVVVLDCECSKGHDDESDRKPSVLGDLFENGVVLYYYHSILKERHHICLAVRKVDRTSIPDLNDTRGWPEPGRVCYN